MKPNINDKKVSKIFSKRAKQKIEPKLSRKLQEKLDIVLKNETEVNRDILLGAFNLIRHYFDKKRQFSDNDYLIAVEKLISIEYINTASNFFIVCASSIANIKFELLVDVIPNDICIDHWIKNSKTPKKTALKSISTS